MPTKQKTFILIAIFIGFFLKKGVNAGVWLNIEGNSGIDLAQFKRKLAWLDQQNDRNVKLDPWTGMRIYLTWGEIPYSGDKDKPMDVKYDFSPIVNLLNAAYQRGDKRSYQVALTISDKLWVYHKNGAYHYAPGALPGFYAEHLGEGDWQHYAVTPEGSNKSILVNEDIDNDGTADNLRFAVANSSTNSAAVRKYSVVRWNPAIRELWFKFWKQLAEYTYIENGVSKELRDHPALYAIITPESSIAGINHNNNELMAIGYVGAESYSDQLLEQVEKLRDSFSGVPVISSINWISDYTMNLNDPNHYQKKLGEKLRRLNQEDNAYGWFAQDLRFDKHFGNASYENMVYPEFAKFDNALCYTMITGDTYNNSNFSAKTKKGIAQELVNFASELGVGQLFFLNQEQKQGEGINSEIFSLLAAADHGDYTFLPALVPKPKPPFVRISSRSGHY